MSLGFGTRPGPYDIVSPLGEGGMGDVYRTRDSTLNRDVAITVVPVDADDLSTIINRAVISRHNARPRRERCGSR
jgi:serine/threonine protein kinase